MVEIGWNSGQTGDYESAAPLSPLPPTLAAMCEREMLRALDPRVGGGFDTRLRRSFAWCALLTVLHAAAEVLRYEGELDALEPGGGLSGEG